MIVAMYFVIKFLAWAGLLFSIFSVFDPHLMLKFFVRSMQCKLKWFGLTGEIRPDVNAEKRTRLWSVVLALIFGALVYVFSYVIVLGYVLKQRFCF